MENQYPLPSEQAVLRDCTDGVVSPDETFDRLYSLYAGPVLLWLRMRVRREAADDLFQEVWGIFLRRWRSWQHSPAMDDPDARPVLSFLYRTSHFVLKAHQRREWGMEPLENARNPTSDLTTIVQTIDFGRCLALAKELCSPEELDVLLAKLAGVSIREIARTFDVTEAVVDHRYRDAIARLRRRLRVQAKGPGRKDNAKT
jgi:DNA-directed RNA polymerase specialized sigma24 family protein